MHRGFSWSPGSWSCSPQNKPLLEEKREHEHASGTVSVAKGHSCRARPGKPAAGGKRAGSAPPSPPTHCLHAHPPISHPPTKDLPPSSACRGCTHTWGGQPDLSSWVRIADQSRPGAGFQGHSSPGTISPAQEARRRRPARCMARHGYSGSTARAASENKLRASSLPDRVSVPIPHQTPSPSSWTS